MTVCICILMMTVLLVAYMDGVRLLHEKEEINQIARKYILRMETVGMLRESDKAALLLELENAGATDISLTGTSVQAVGYGENLILLIRGRLEGRYEFEEKRVSTAKY